MKLRDALVQQAPSLELQRAAHAEIARLDHSLRVALDALAAAQGALILAGRFADSRVTHRADAVLELSRVERIDLT